MAAGTRRHFTLWPSIKPAPAVAAAPVLAEELDQIYFDKLSLFLLFGMYPCCIVFPKAANCFQCTLYILRCRLLTYWNPNSRSFARQ